MRRARGAALLWVVWILLLGTALLAYGLLATARVQAYASVARQQSQMQALAAAGLDVAAWRLTSSPSQVGQWLDTGGEAQWRIGEATLVVQARDESGKLDLLAVTPDVLSAYLLAQGINHAEAGSMAAAVQEARVYDSSRDPVLIERVSQLGRLTGFTPERLRRLAGDFTVHSGRAMPVRRWASPAVQAVVPADADPMSAPSGIYGVSVRVDAPGKPSVWAHTILQISPINAAERSYRVLSWSRGVGKNIGWSGEWMPRNEQNN